MSRSSRSRTHGAGAGPRAICALLMWGALAAGPAVQGQLTPPGGGGDPWLVQVDLPAAPDSTHTRFELTLFDTAAGPAAMDITVPSTMPDLHLAAYGATPWGEELAQEVTFDQAFWTSLAELAGALAPYQGADFTTLSGAQNQDAADSILEFTSDIADILTGDVEDLLEEMVTSLWEDAVITVVAEISGLACGEPYLKALKSLISLPPTHFDLLNDILSSATTCKSRRPTFLSIAYCSAEITGWTFATGGIFEAIGASLAVGPEMISFMSGVEADRIGQDLFADRGQAAAIARDAKEVEQAARLVYLGLDTAAIGVGVVAASSFGDFGVLDAAGDELGDIGGARGDWVEAHGCLRRVIAPRLEASVVRSRFFLETENGRVPLLVDGEPILTSLPRNDAKAQVIEIDAAALYALDPGAISAFDEHQQIQSLSVRICEGVVIGADPGWLLDPSQQAGTDYWIGDLGFGPSCVSSWWAGLHQDRTLMVKPFDATTVHRVCENHGFIDNDNDGFAEANYTDECFIHPDRYGADGLPPSYPPGDAEEDLATAALGLVPGQTAWTEHGVDMMCNGAVLPLISPDGLSGRVVRQEWVASTASCWTRASDGEQVSDHDRASTQLRFALVDSSWGEPRPRGCYDYDAQLGRWVCNGNAGCPACAGPPDPGLGGLP